MRAIPRPMLLGRCLSFSSRIACSGCCPRGFIVSPVNHAAPIELAFERRGEGPPMLLIHGFGGYSYSWRHIIDPLSRSHTVITIDLKGFGKSPRPRDGAYSLRDQAQLVCKFVEQHNLRNLTLVGNSFGGGVALMAAVSLLNESEPRVSRLILVDSIGYPQKFPGFITALRTPIIGELGVCLFLTKGQIRRHLTSCYYRPELITDEQVEAYHAMVTSRGGRYALLETARHLVPDNIDDLLRDYGTIRIPTLLIWGENDRIVP